MKNKKTSKIAAAVGAVVAFIFLCGGIAGFYIWIMNIGGLPVVVPIVLAVIYVIPVVAVIAALIQRIKEIKGGEEDEASDY